jgi:glycosyltransferase involved in cell wall biosynthesis
MDRVRFLANSRFVASRARERLGVDAQVIPPLIDHKAYATPTKRRTVTLINPHPKKGGNIALGLASARPDIPFEFIESWRAARVLAPLRAQAAKLPNVRWRRPILDRKQVFRNTRILIVPSQLEEAWGRVVNEAQASGIPVVASRIGGLAESVGKGGLLVSPVDDPAVWLRTLSRVWDDPEEYERLSKAALENIRQPDLQPDALISRLLGAIGEVRSRRSVTDLTKAPR